jgi:hypothetical protein
MALQDYYQYLTDLLNKQYNNQSNQLQAQQNYAASTAQTAATRAARRAGLTGALESKLIQQQQLGATVPYLQQQQQLGAGYEQQAADIAKQREQANQQEQAARLQLLLSAVPAAGFMLGQTLANTKTPNPNKSLEVPENIGETLADLADATGLDFYKVLSGALAGTESVSNLDPKLRSKLAPILEFLRSASPAQAVTALGNKSYRYSDSIKKIVFNILKQREQAAQNNAAQTNTTQTNNTANTNQTSNTNNK